MKKQITTTTKEGNKLVVTISTERECFSVTGDLYENGRHVACGCLHEDILEALPELKPLVDLHLSDLEGVPMHAFENGFYWLTKIIGLPVPHLPDQDEKTCLKIFMEHMRIDEGEAHQIIGKVTNAYIDGRAKIATSPEVTENCRQNQDKQGIFDARVCFKKIVDESKSRWKEQAERALKIFGLQ